MQERKRGLSVCAQTVMREADVRTLDVYVPAVAKYPGSHKTISPHRGVEKVLFSPSIIPLSLDPHQNSPRIIPGNYSPLLGSPQEGYWVVERP